MILSSHRSEPECFRDRGGFSLIEVIATIALSAVLIALLLPLLDSGLQGSRRALLRMPETHSLRTQMDAMWHLYRAEYGNNLPGFSTAIDEAAAGQSSYTLISNTWVDFDAAGVEFIPPAGTQNALRVTLGNDQGERLTTYFFPIPVTPVAE